MQQTYRLKLDMLLMTLQAHQQSCTLVANVPAGALPASDDPRERRKLQVACRAELVVQEGRVAACLLRERVSGRVIVQGTAALDLLRSCEALAWSMHESPTAALPTASISGGDGHLSWGQSRRAAGTRPRRCTADLSGELVARLPHKQRQVVLLVNGERTIADLCRMLHCTPTALGDMLDELAALQLITFAEP